MQEEWKVIKFTDTDGKIHDYTGLYEISNMGRVRSLNYRRTGEVKILKQTSNGNGYLRVFLYNNKKPKKFYVHRLVATMFIPNPNNLQEVNHINEIKTDCRVENLEWCNREYNMNYGTRIERAIETKKNIDMKTSNKKVICLNTKDVFNSIKEATQWCGLKSDGNIIISCKNKKRTCGKHPITGERLHWMYYDKWLQLNEKTKNSKIKCDLEFFIV